VILMSEVAKGESEFPEFYDDIDQEIRDMFELAEKEGRQPNCIYCGQPLEIGQSFYTDVSWKWNAETRKYEKFQEDCSDCDKPYCLKCGHHDWDFTNNRWVQY
jgi:hypothetical protein